MTCRYLVMDVFDGLATLDDNSVDLIVSSPPFLALRSYLPADHPDKAKEIGSEKTPGEFLDVLLDVVEACARVLAPHGSLVFELGDTYSGARGYGSEDGNVGVYGERSAERWREARVDRSFKKADDGWPLEKSKVLVPQLFAVALAYGFNPLTGRKTEPWRVRNTVAWCRPNPPVGRDGDKFRPATSFLTVATKARDRYWDGDAVRHPNPRSDEPSMQSPRDFANYENGNRGKPTGAPQNPAGAPLLDWWELPTHPFRGQHYATFPPALVVPLVKSMCPQKVCRVCGEPSRRIVEVTQKVITYGHFWNRDKGGDRLEAKPGNYSGRRGDESAVKEKPSHHQGFVREATTLGWSDCGHDSWRPGLVLDPFAGSGTTLAVASGHGLDSVGIDLDPRNADLARERCGMFLEVEYPEHAA